MKRGLVVIGASLAFMVSTGACSNGNTVSQKSSGPITPTTQSSTMPWRAIGFDHAALELTYDSALAELAAAFTGASSMGQWSARTISDLEAAAGSIEAIHTGVVEGMYGEVDESAATYTLTLAESFRMWSDSVTRAVACNNELADLVQPNTTELQAKAQQCKVALNAIEQARIALITAWDNLYAIEN